MLLFGSHWWVLWRKVCAIFILFPSKESPSISILRNSSPRVDLDPPTFADFFYLSPFADNFCKIVFDSFPSLALSSFWPAYDSLASKWKLTWLSTLRLFWSTLRVPIEASHGFQLTDKRRQQDRWLDHARLPHLSCYSFTKRRQIVTIFYCKGQMRCSWAEGTGEEALCSLTDILKGDTHPLSILYFDRPSCLK